MKRKVKRFMENLRSIGVEEKSPVAEVDVKLLEKFPERLRDGLKTFAKQMIFCTLQK